MSVSVDGSWQKRYGFNSLLGMVFLISIDTGCVLDYVVKSVFCHECKKNPNATESWKTQHKNKCMINHEGSSGAMEKEGAITMFTRSIDKHNMRYTVYVGDGDLKDRAMKSFYSIKGINAYPTKPTPMTFSLISTCSFDIPCKAWFSWV